MTLFDLPPLPEPEPGEPKPSRAVALRLRNEAHFAAGHHAANQAPLDPNPEHRCGGCLYHWVMGGHAKDYHKCEKHRLGMSASDASDIRVGWPACVFYSPADEALECGGCAGKGWVPIPVAELRQQTGVPDWMRATNRRCVACNGRGMVPA